MARPTYPSDHRRYFHVLEDILDSPKLRDEVSADVFRFYIRLLAMLNRTKSRDGKINLGRRALNLCAGREQRRHALAIARAGAVASLYTLSVEGEQALICVRNWAKHQDFTPPELRSDSDGTPPPNPNPLPNPNPTPSKESRKGKPPPPDWALWVAGLLASELRIRLPGARVPADLGDWAREIAKIEADPGDVAELTRWLYSIANDGQYRIEVQSGRALREKFGKALAAKSRQEFHGTGNGGTNAGTPRPHTLEAGVKAILERAERASGDRREVNGTLPGTAGGGPGDGSGRLP